MELQAYAKLNLSLDITGKLENGYHTVDMVMQSISLSDRVCVTLNDTGLVQLTCSKPHIPTDMRNTAVKAAQYFLDATGLPYGAEIYIEKNIPDQAGMGGGSADAAAVLRAMNQLCQARLGEAPLLLAELLYLGARIGADVPFCILNGTKRCMGIGEEMIPLAPMEHCHMVIVKPAVGVSTPEGYRLCDTVPDTGKRYTPGMIRALENHDLTAVAKALGNRFDDVLQLPDVNRVKAVLLEQHAMNALMTGSGSAVFGLFRTEADALQAASVLREMGEQVFLATPISGN